MTKSNKLGYVASFPIPEVIRGINSAILGARSVNPKAEIRVVWVSTWYDPGKESDAAKALIDQGVMSFFSTPIVQRLVRLQRKKECSVLDKPLIILILLQKLNSYYRRLGSLLY